MILDFTAHASVLDQSVNFVAPAADGMFEARYVRRVRDYFIAYLSSHTGCDQSCRMCHLTQTRQRSMVHASRQDYLAQADRVLAHYDGLDEPANLVHFNFMARGEPLLNTGVRRDWPRLHRDLTAKAQERGLEALFNISTIMPSQAILNRLTDVFRDTQGVRLYYSLYSMRPEFRRRWLPYAMNPERALDKLADWQVATGGAVVLHWSFIEGENDDFGTVDEIIEAVRRRGLKTRFNLVRYNPYSPAQGKEPNVTLLAELFNHLAFHLDNDRSELLQRIDLSRIVPRVGFDVKASCGMFMEA
ncbi:Fe-S-cluster redox domain-containing [Caulobacter phage CcrColossus]|uniref:Putative radical SAM-like protein n=1 Tax=Caulobacter phage CcrColossus TaxID=1211640 RepID=K4JW79_9CAUD|nr:Fe-S-cluster redox domain-containing [Caulobacter phage CcrColossus]AFU88153.1 putative radical SAM-like protein [Caulobacter phage CcrColossus]